jgi:hypothetical protein
MRFSLPTSYPPQRHRARPLAEQTGGSDRGNRTLARRVLRSSSGSRRPRNPSPHSQRGRLRSGPSFSTNTRALSHPDNAVAD